jgi:arylsulfatase A-like enzyme
MLAVMYTAPHAAGPNPNPQPPDNCANAPKPAPRHATAFDSEPLPQPPNFNEADVSDKPPTIQEMAPIDEAGFNNIQRRYRCMLESLLSVDEGVGRMLDALDAAGELDDTLFAFTSDNGFFAGEHRLQRGKNRVYEEAVRVPLVLRGPGIPAGVEVDDLAINADLAATVVDAAGATAGRALDGRSLLPFAERPERLRGRELLIEQGDQSDPADEVQGIAYSAILTSRYKYVDNRSGELELYDLELDPYELQNEAANPAYDEVEAALAQRLENLKACAAEGCRTKPALKQKLPRSTRGNGRSCRERRDFLVRVRGADMGKVEEAAFYVGSKRSGRDRSAPIKKEIRPRLLRGKRKPQIRVIAELLDGRELSLQKRARICR